MSVRLRRTWTEPLQLQELTPVNGATLLIDWCVEPQPVDAGVPHSIKQAIAETLTTAGKVAFRWQGEAVWPASEATVFRPPARGPLQRFAERLTDRWPVGLALTSSPTVAVLMFDEYWELQGQAALLLTPGAELSDLLQIDLATRREWTDFAFPPAASALVVPAVDGSGVLLSAATEQGLVALQAALHDAFEMRGIDQSSVSQ